MLKSVIFFQNYTVATLQLIEINLLQLQLREPCGKIDKQELLWKI